MQNMQNSCINADFSSGVIKTHKVIPRGGVLRKLYVCQKFAMTFATPCHIIKCHHEDH